MEFFRDEYSFLVNSEDKYDNTIPLRRSHAFGGTLMLWKNDLHPFIEPVTVKTSSFLPIILHPLGSSPSIHICIYLPTAGKDKQFVEELTALSSALHDLSFLHPGTPVYLRGDFNVSNNNKKRRALLDRFMESEGLTETIICHPTYHHFMGSGSGDSHLDKVLYSSNAPIEIIHTIVCKNENPLVESHHDIILSE